VTEVKSGPPLYREGDIEFDFSRPEHVGAGLIQRVVDELRGVGKCPSTGPTAARTSWAMEEIGKDYGHEIYNRR